jgi:hypothetical protein
MSKLNSIARLSQRLFDGHYKNDFSHAALYVPHSWETNFLLSYFLLKFVDVIKPSPMNGRRYKRNKDTENEQKSYLPKTFAS